MIDTVVRKLEGKRYKLGFDDCYSLVRDYYAERFGLVFPNYARPYLFQTDPNLNLIERLFAREGFIEVPMTPSAVLEGDILLMKVGMAEVIHHFALYVGRGQMLHHLRDQLSKTEPYTHKWHRRVVKILRHKDYEKLCLENVPRHINALPEKVKRRLTRPMEGGNDDTI